MTRTLTPKAAGAISIVAVLLFAGLLLGRVELVALAAPFVLSLVWGLAASADPGVKLAADLETDRAIQGEDVTLVLRISSELPVGEALVGVVLQAGLEVVSGERYTTVSLPGDAEWSSRLALAGRRWGSYTPGPVVVRAYGPGRYVAFERTVEDKCPAATIEVWNLRAGRRTQTIDPGTRLANQAVGCSGTPGISDLVLSESGTPAWIALPGDDGQLIVKTGDRILDRGREIELESLELDRLTISWRHGTETKQAGL